MRIKNFIHNSDKIGVLSSALCLIHCIVTPFLIGTILFSDSQVHSYHLFDYIFLIISFIAVWFSTHKHANPYIKIALWSFFTIFAITLIIKHWFPYAQYILYTSSFGLIAAHIYNWRYCGRLGRNVEMKEYESV